MVSIGLIRDDDADGARKVELFEFEMCALLEAVRRDYRREREMSLCGASEEKRWHAHNARRNLSLLEALQPKHPVAALPRQDATPVESALPAAQVLPLAAAPQTEMEA